MKTYKSAVYLLFLSTVFCSAEKVPDILTMLPSAAGNWKPSGQPQQYEGEDLYILIDGGAEIYHEYGFTRVVEQEYVSGDRSISCEIFEMNSADAAFGIYSFKRGEGGTELDIGTDCMLQSYYLNFRKGRYLVTLTGFDDTDDTAAGLKALAASTAEKINDEGDYPKIVSLLPEKGLMKNQIKYFTGNLGLFNDYSFSVEDIFQCSYIAKGVYANGASLYLFLYSNAETASEQYKHIINSFNQSSHFSNGAEQNEFQSYTGKQDEPVRIAQTGRVVIIIRNCVDYGVLSVMREEILQKMHTYKDDPN